MTDHILLNSRQVEVVHPRGFRDMSELENLVRLHDIVSLNQDPLHRQARFPEICSGHKQAAQEEKGNEPKCQFPGRFHARFVFNVSENPTSFTSSSRRTPAF
ncbi:hypothetical protein D3C83_69640 [compost metagenome]